MKTKTKLAIFVLVVMSIALGVLITAIVCACKNNVSLATEFATWGEYIKSWFITAKDWIIGLFSKSDTVETLARIK